MSVKNYMKEEIERWKILHRTSFCLRFTDLKVKKGKKEIRSD